jgi:hypothetical protein
MAIIEIVLPQLKKDGALIKELEKTVVPVLRRKLQEAGALKAMRGWFATEDGRDVRDQFREILVVGAYKNPSNFFLIFLLSGENPRSL